VVTPGPEQLNYPTILDFPAPVLSGYSRETVMAEKLQALTQLRMSNTRMKDYFDLWLLSRQPELNKAILRKAIERTFENRKMEIEVEPVGLSSEFGADPVKQVQWKAFLKRSSLTAAPDSLTDVVEEIRLFFFEPVLIQ
jgi:predicted nucleotidyltransferase component of viral defense system